MKRIPQQIQQIGLRRLRPIQNQSINKAPEEPILAKNGMTTIQPNYKQEKKKRQFQR